MFNLDVRLTIIGYIYVRIHDPYSNSLKHTQILRNYRFQVEQNYETVVERGLARNTSISSSMLRSDASIW